MAIWNNVCPVCRLDIVDWAILDCLWQHRSQNRDSYRCASEEKLMTFVYWNNDWGWDVCILVWRFHASYIHASPQTWPELRLQGSISRQTKVCWEQRSHMTCESLAFKCRVGAVLSRSEEYAENGITLPLSHRCEVTSCMEPRVLKVLRWWFPSGVAITVSTSALFQPNRMEEGNQKIEYNSIFYL